MRTIKSTAEGRPSLGGSQSPEYSHMKIEFNKFTVEEAMRVDGCIEKVLKVVGRDQVQKLLLKVGGAEYDVPCGGGELTCTVKKLELPAQGWLTLEYVDVGKPYYVDDYPVEIKFSFVTSKESGSCCAIA